MRIIPPEPPRQAFRRDAGAVDRFEALRKPTPTRRRPLSNGASTGKCASVRRRPHLPFAGDHSGPRPRAGWRGRRGALMVSSQASDDPIARRRACSRSERRRRLRRRRLRMTPEPGGGSLLLGIYDDPGLLDHLGITSRSPMRARPDAQARQAARRTGSRDAPGGPAAGHTAAANGNPQSKLVSKFSTINHGGASATHAIRAWRPQAAAAAPWSSCSAMRGHRGVRECGYRTAAARHRPARRPPHHLPRDHVSARPEKAAHDARSRDGSLSGRSPSSPRDRAAPRFGPGASRRGRHIG